MKKLHTWALVGLVMSAAVFTPSMVLANGISATSSGAVMTGDGTVRVWGAQVTQVVGTSISAVSTFGSRVLNWVVNISGDTEVTSVDNAGATGSTSAEIKAGDRIAFVGALTSLGATVSVDADKVKEIATSTYKHKDKDKKRGEKEVKHKDKDKNVRDASEKRGWSLGFWNHFFARADR